METKLRAQHNHNGKLQAHESHKRACYFEFWMCGQLGEATKMHFEILSFKSGFH